MTNYSLKLLSALMKRSESKTSLMGIEKLLTLGIPFNRPHGIRLNVLDDTQAVMELPFKRANKNHLGTMHACAIATLGEFPAGLLLIKLFSPEKFRVVMTKLDVEYLKHGSGKLIGRSYMPEDSLADLKERLTRSDKIEIEMETNVLNEKGLLIAQVKTTWQLKSWDQVKKSRKKH